MSKHKIVANNLYCRVQYSSCVLNSADKKYIYIFTWVPGGEVEVGEVDDIVVALLLLVEEPDLRRPAHHVVRNHALHRTNRVNKKRKDAGIRSPKYSNVSRF